MTELPTSKSLKSTDVFHFQGTFLVTMFLIMMYILEVLIFRYLGFSHPMVLISQRSLPTIIELFVFLLAPFLHSSADHLLSNLVLFVPMSILYERWTALEEHLTFLIFGGWIINVGFPVAGKLIELETSLGIGMSGIVYAIAAHETIQQGHFIWFNQDAITWIDFAHFTIALGVATFSLLQLIHLPQPPSVSNKSHIFGLLFGSSIAIYRIIDIDLQYGP